MVAAGGEQRRQVRQRLGVLRLQVQGLAVEILGFLLLPGDIAEQPEPVEDRGRRPTRGQLALAGGTRLAVLAGIRQAGDFVELADGTGEGLAAGWRNQAGQPLARFRRWRGFAGGGGEGRTLARSTAAATTGRAPSLTALGRAPRGASLVRRNTKDSGTPIGCMPCWLSRLASAGPMNIAPSDRNRRLSTSTTSLWVGRSK